LLGFQHPVTGEPMEFTSPLPADMAALLAYLEKKYDVAREHQSVEGQ
jgi:23S rRNA pseudouridine1911/1915/1917 synthase